MVYIYNHLWFIPAIITLYIIFPFYYKQFLKSNNKFIFTTLIITTWVLLSIILSNVIREDLFGFINRIPVFLIGILIGWLTQNKQIVFTKYTYLFLFIILVTGLQFSYLTTYKELYILFPGFNYSLPNLLISTSLPFLMAKVFDKFKEFKITQLIIKVLAFYGLFSLELYCVQEILVLFLKNNYNMNYGPFGFNIISIFLSTLLGYILFLINKHFWIKAENLYIKLKKNK